MFQLFHKVVGIAKRSTFLYTFSSFFSKVVSLFLVRIYTKNLDITEFGLIDFVLIILALVNVSFGLEISQALSRYAPLVRGNSSKTLLFSTAFWITVLMMIFVILISFCVGMFPLTKMYRDVLPLLSIYFSLSLMHLLLKNNLRWTGRAKAFFFQSLIYTLIVFILTLVLVELGNFGLRGVYYSLIIGTFLSSIYCFWAQKSLITPIISFRFARFILGFSVPLIFSSLAIISGSFLDRIFITSKLGLDQLAVYSIGHRLASVTGFLVFGLISSYAPVIYGSPYLESTKIAFERLFVYLVTMTFFVVLLLVFFGESLVLFISDDQYLEASNVSVVLTLSIVLGGSIILFPGLFVEKRTATFARLNIGLVGLNLMFNWLAISFFETLMAVAYATLLAQSLYFIVNGLYSWKYYKKSFVSFRKYYLQFALISLVILGQSFGLVTQLDLVMRTVMLVILSFIFVYPIKRFFFQHGG